MKKAALFFDVDGTLIDEQTKIVPESTLRALKQARENGHLVFINTGRTSCNTLDSMKHIPVDGLSYWIPKLTAEVAVQATSFA